MKQRSSLITALCLSCVLTASCSSKEPPQTDAANITPEPEPQAYTEVALGDTDNGSDKEGATPKPKKNLKTRGTAPAPAVNIDLTAMSATMVYATVYKIMSSPKEYLGKTIRTSGPYQSVYFEDTKTYYHFVVVEDATACCKQGFEFLWKGNHAYPDDYPEEETKIVVAGTFKSYEEQGKTYFHLVADEVVLAK